MRAGRHEAGWCPWTVPALARDAAGLGLTTLAVAALLYALAPGRQPPIGHAVAAGLAQLVWCHCDGMVGRLGWGLAAVEALLCLRVELAWVEVLFEALGPGAG